MFSDTRYNRYRITRVLCRGCQFPTMRTEVPILSYKKNDFFPNIQFLLSSGFDSRLQLNRVLPRHIAESEQVQPASGLESY